MAKNKQKISSLGKYEGYQKKGYKKSLYRSQYIESFDATKLAIDCHIPKGDKGEKFPTIIYFLRYTRQFDLKFPFSLVNSLGFGTVKKKEINFFNKNGYACVLVDLRGSGASYGSRKMEFSEEELKDMKEALDWISLQEWSNGKTATTGSSYTGTTAEFALITKHPSLKAAVVRSNIFDLYTDVNFPGGLREAPFIEAWQKTIYALDNSDYKVFHKLANNLISGAKPVQEDKKKNQISEAMEEHRANFDVAKGVFEVESRDQKLDSLDGMCHDDFSLHGKMKEVEKSKVPIYRMTGWYDGAIVNSSIKGFWNIKNTQKVIIGPWDHGFRENIDPFVKSQKRRFNILKEILRFLDYNVKGIENGINKEPVFSYYKMGKNEFDQVDNWPVNKKHKEYVLSKNQLVSDFVEAGEIDYVCDYNLQTGKGARYRSLIPIFRDGKIHYKNRKDQTDRMVTFKTAPFDKDVEVTGHAEIELYLSCDATDAQIFVYLEDVSSNGNEVNYITEGMLRAKHRKISNEEDRPYKDVAPYHSFKVKDIVDVVPGEIFKLNISFLPISYTIKKGRKLQVSIGTSDIDHFDLKPVLPSNLKIHYGKENPSKLLVPFN